MFLMAAFSAGRPKASQPIGCRTLKPRIHLYRASASPMAVGLPAGGFAGPDDVAWTALEASGFALVLGRDGQPFRARERMQIAVLCRIADRRLQELPA